MTIPMPDPIYEIGDYPSNGEVMCDCYSLEQLEAYADARVREALTEVAEMCDNVFSFSVGDSVRDLMYKMLSENNTTDKC